MQLVAALVAFFLLAMPARADDLAACGDLRLAEDARIEACTRNIARGDITDRERAMHLLLRGGAYYARGDFDAALADYSQSIDLHRDAGTLAARADVWLHKRDFARGIADYDEALRLDPGVILWLIERGDAWRAGGDLDRAIKDYNAALKIDSNFVHAYLRRADA